MQSTATTKASADDDLPSIVRSVRFLPDQWLFITAKCDELGVPVGRFLRNAALSAAGAPTEAINLRRLADTLDNLPGRGGKKIKPVVKAHQARSRSR